MSVEPQLLPVFIEAAIAAFSVLGGAMAVASGLLGTLTYFRSWRIEDVANEINRGIVWGFVFGGAPAAIVFMIAVVSR